MREAVDSLPHTTHKLLQVFGRLKGGSFFRQAFDARANGKFPVFPFRRADDQGSFP